MKVLVIEPIRYCTFSSGPCPSTEVRAPCHTARPSRTTVATSEGARPSAWATAIRCNSALRVPGSKSS